MHEGKDKDFSSHKNMWSCVWTFEGREWMTFTAYIDMYCKVNIWKLKPCRFYIARSVKYFEHGLNKGFINFKWIIFMTLYQASSENVIIAPWMVFIIYSLKASKFYFLINSVLYFFPKSKMPDHNIQSHAHNFLENKCNNIRKSVQCLRVSLWRIIKGFYMIYSMVISWWQKKASWHLDLLFAPKRRIFNRWSILVT